MYDYVITACGEPEPLATLLAQTGLYTAGLTLTSGWTPCPGGPGRPTRAYAHGRHGNRPGATSWSRLLAAHPALNFTLSAEGPGGLGDVLLHGTGPRTWSVDLHPVPAPLILLREGPEKYTLLRPWAHDVHTADLAGTLAALEQVRTTPPARTTMLDALTRAVYVSETGAGPHIVAAFDPDRDPALPSPDYRGVLYPAGAHIDLFTTTFHGIRPVALAAKTAVGGADPVFYLPTPALTLPWLLTHEDCWGEIFASSGPGAWVSPVTTGQARQLLPESADLLPELLGRNEVGALTLALARVCEHNDPTRAGIREAAEDLVAAVAGTLS